MEATTEAPLVQRRVTETGTTVELGTDLEIEEEMLGTEVLDVQKAVEVEAETDQEVTLRWGKEGANPLKEMEIPGREAAMEHEVDLP